MTGRRGREYADRLTEPERQTLDLLLAHVRERAAPIEPEVEASGRRARVRSWRQPLAAALSVAAIVAVAAVVAWYGSPGLPPWQPASPSAARPAPISIGTWLDRLATAAGGVPATPPGESPRRSFLFVTETGGADSCRVAGLSGQIEWYRKASAGTPVTTARIDLAELVPVPDGAESWTIGCGRDRPRDGRRPQPWASAYPSPQVSEDATAPTEQGPAFTETWQVLIEGWAYRGVRLPVVPDPYRLGGQLAIEHVPADVEVLNRVLDDLTDTAPSPAAARWALVVELLTNPVAAPALRVAALRAAPLAGVVEVTDRTADLTGRPGTTWRVPYQSDGRATTAELTFDAHGGVLQRVVQVAGGGEPQQEITVFQPQPADTG